MRNTITIESVLRTSRPIFISTRRLNFIAGMFECHDKARFEITAISYGPADPTEMRARLQASNEHFIDAGAASDDWIDKLIRESKIDILIDLNPHSPDEAVSCAALTPIQI